MELNELQARFCFRSYASDILAEFSTKEADGTTDFAAATSKTLFLMLVGSSFTGVEISILDSSRASEIS